MSAQQESTCPKCRKQKNPASRSGSLTSVIFQDTLCSCDEIGGPTVSFAARAFERCPLCDMIVSSASASLTSFLLQDICCQCGNSQADREQFQSNQSSQLLTRFQRFSQSPTRLTVAEEKLAIRPGDTRVMLDLKIGDEIGGYKLLELVGKGGMGFVFLAEHLLLDRICAVKVLAPSLVSPASWKMFQNEAKIVSGLNHPSICRIFDLGIHQEILPFYAMELLSGETLDSIITRQGALSVGGALEIFASVAEGLEYAHSKGIVHRDIKPANIMLCPDSNGNLTVKILDFGIAELVTSNSVQRRTPRNIVGSANYMSPEQFVGQGIDTRCDIYGLGCSMFEALSGQPPFTGDSWKELSQKHINQPIPHLSAVTEIEFPKELDAIVTKTLAKSPDQRYRNAAELAVDIGNLMESKPLEFATSELREIDEESIESKPRRVVSIGGNWTLFLVLLSATVLLTAVYFTVSKLVTSRPIKEASVRTTPVKPAQPVERSRKFSANNTKLVQQAAEALEAKNYSETLELTTEAIRRDPSCAAAYAFRGMDYSILEKPEEAIKDLTMAVKLNPKLWTEWVGEALAKSYIDTGQFKEALVQLDRSLHVSKTSNRLREKGQVLCELKRYQEALRNFDQAIKLSPDEYWLYFDRGSLYANLNQHAEAIKDFSRVIELRPGEARGYALRAKSYLALGMKDRARVDGEKVKALGASGWEDVKQQGKNPF